VPSNIHLQRNEKAKIVPVYTQANEVYLRVGVHPFTTILTSESVVVTEMVSFMLQLLCPLGKRVTSGDRMPQLISYIGNKKILVLALSL
jgi:hypothetical protein